MTLTERKLELVDDLVRLRRLGHLVPGNEDLAIVRSRLERELGETVSRRLAANVLGISHTALDRWIRNRDLPTVFAPNGRIEIPVTALLDLAEHVEQERKAGRRRHVLEPSMKAARDQAERLDPVALVGGPGSIGAGHRKAETRSLAYHRALAKRLRRPMVDEAAQKIWQWRRDGRIDPRYADEWEQILQMPIAQIRAVISEDCQRANDLRQNSPFAGMLSEPERRRIVSALG